VPDLAALEHNAYLILLDGLDEVSAAARAEVVASVVDATNRWPQHRWVVSSRPIEDCLGLVEAGFESFRIWPSSAWGSAYLDRRGIDTDDRRALEEAGGFDDLISIPLFAAAAADRLIAGTLPERPLDLLVDLQRDAVHQEQARRAVTGSLFDWVRRLGVGLEVRGRSTASVAELGSVAGPEAPPGPDLRERLVKATLLAELPDVASFQRKTFQEALCADAILASSDIARMIRELAVTEVAGEIALRSDIEFTIDLVFENGTSDQRERLRALDPLRWARTVITSGTERDAHAAFELIWNSVSDPRRRLSNHADFLIRSQQRAIGAIGRKWPSVIEQRRDGLVEQTKSAYAVERYNAAAALASVGPTGDDKWLIELLTDSDEGVARQAVSASIVWRGRDMVEVLWEALDEVNPGSTVWRDIVVALADLAETQDDFERVALAADARGTVLSHLLPRLLGELERDRVISLLGRRWPSDPRLWHEVIARGLLPGAAGCNDDQVADLTRSLLRRGVTISDVVDLPELARMLAEQSAIVLRVVGKHAEVHRRDYSVFALLWAIPPAARERASDTLDDYIADLDQQVENYLPAVRRVSWTQQVTEQLDAGEIDEEHPAGRTEWPRDLDEEHRRRLADLSQEWWPFKPLVEVRVHSGDPQDKRALAAVSAGAASGAPLPKERWLDLFEAHQLTEFVPSSFRWLTGHYDEKWAPDVADVIRRAPDGHSISSCIAALPVLDQSLLDAVVTRLTEVDEGGMWSNAVWLLRERGHLLELRRLLAASLSDSQRLTLQAALAEQGDEEAQVAVLTNHVVRAKRGETLNGLWWRKSVRDPRVIDLIGDLILALPKVPLTEGARIGLEPRRAAEGILATAESERAIQVYDRLIAADTTGAQYDLSRNALLRRLATAAVLRRLPERLAEAANLVLPPEPPVARR
jgi:hypothetical protein